MLRRTSRRHLRRTPPRGSVSDTDRDGWQSLMEVVVMPPMYPSTSSPTPPRRVDTWSIWIVVVGVLLLIGAIGLFLQAP